MGRGVGVLGGCWAAECGCDAIRCDLASLVGVDGLADSVVWFGRFGARWGRTLVDDWSPVFRARDGGEHWWMTGVRFFGRGGGSRTGLSSRSGWMVLRSGRRGSVAGSGSGVRSSFRTGCALPGRPSGSGGRSWRRIRVLSLLRRTRSCGLRRRRPVPDSVARGVVI